MNGMYWESKLIYILDTYWELSQHMFQWNFTKHMACGYNQNNKINMPRFEQSATKKKLKEQRKR